MVTPIQASIRTPQNAISPSPIQLALAMAIVKHKPTDMGIKDHILQIRQHIKVSDGPSRPILEDKFFDSVAFWQQAYEKSEAEQSKLLDRIYELEMRNEGLLAKVKFGRDTDANGDMVEAGKRKGNTNATDSGSAKKKTKTKGLPTSNSGLCGVLGTVDGIDRVECLNETTASFMRRFYTLQKALQKRANCPNIVLAAVGLCKAVEGELLRAVSGRGTGMGPLKTGLPLTEQPDFAVALYGVEYAFKLLLQAIGKLSSTENAVHDVGQITYHLVCLYDAIMKTLQNHCQTKAERKKPNSIFTKKKPAPKPRKRQTERTVETPSKPEEEVATQVTCLLGKMALSLDTACIEHQDLLGGFLFILLTRIGKIMCLFIFQDMLRPDLYIDPATLPLPEGLNGADTSDKSLLAARMEAKSLVWLLERTMTLLNPRPPLSDTINHMEFVSKIKERLHDTVFQAVFGPDDPLFQNPLAYPLPPAGLQLDSLRDPQVTEIPTSDWFLQELWRLLGHEIMVKERHKA